MEVTNTIRHFQREFADCPLKKVPYVHDEQIQEGIG